MNSDLLDLLVGVALLLAAVGVVIPVLPGVALAVATLLLWALLTPHTGAWWLLAATVGIIAAGQGLKYWLPGRRMTAAGIPRSSLIAGGLAGIVGFFAIPIVGLPVGFVAGTYVAEQMRVREWAAARRSTGVALRATGLAMLIELASVLLAGTFWLSRIVLGG